MSLRRPGMASPALAVLVALASRRSLFCFRARALLSDIAFVTQTWMGSFARLVRVVVVVVEASEKSVF